MLVFDIREYLKTDNGTAVERNENSDAEFLKNALAEISLHMESMDMDAIQKVLDDICVYQWDETTYAAISKIKSCIGKFDYTGLETAVEKLMADIQ